MSTVNKGTSPKKTVTINEVRESEAASIFYKALRNHPGEIPDDVFQKLETIFRVVEQETDPELFTEIIKKTVFLMNAEMTSGKTNPREDPTQLFFNILTGEASEEAELDLGQLRWKIWEKVT